MNGLPVAAQRVDCVVIGAGVIGLAVARALALAGREVLVLDRAAAIGTETSSRNSEVIHAGLYYAPGSLKARLCRDGRDRLYAYCGARGIPHRRLGKLIVATSPAELGALAAIRATAAVNGVTDLEDLGPGDVAALEPVVRAAGGLWSPATGIIDGHQYMLALAGDIEAAGGTIACRAPVIGGRVTADGFRLAVGGADPVELACRLLVNAAGLSAPALAQEIAGIPAAAVPAQYLAIGHYYALTGAAPFRHLVYPLPAMGALGVHVTLDMAGAARFGPDIRWVDHIDYRFDDSRRAAFIAAIRRYYPDLDPVRLAPAYTGIRPRLDGPPGGGADFRIDGPAIHGVPGLVQLFGIESPGLTASLAIAEQVRASLCA